jgi:type IV pilus assembly protein PilQ
MLHQPRFSTAIRRTTLVLLQVCLFGVLAVAAPKEQLTITNITATTSGQSTLITVSGTAPLPYSVLRPDARTIFVELPGVDTSRLAQSYKLSTPLVEEVSVERGRKAGLRVTLRTAVIDRSQLADNNLVLVLSPKTPVETAHAVKDLNPVIATPQVSAAAQQPMSLPSPTPSVGLSPGKAQQSAQGQHYGESGFVGEPINLNIVNADIRDILNYITEQYGINFVIDKSVGGVSVTVNVQDVPWNVALDAVLKANRLGVDVSGNILRVATTEILAKEAEIQKVLKDSRLDASGLVTEIIRLNYARALESLNGASGGTAVFTGGLGRDSQFMQDAYHGGASPIQSNNASLGILPIIQRRLSRRGSVEVDGRTNTLIVTDVRENIDSIRQLVVLLDQPEPQVEIETRIVIASRSFSRDLGVQINALALNTNTGGTAGFGTAKPSPLANATGGATNTIGLRPAGIPQGILDPSGALGANLPNTVIGLTTGMIGTAQISALITAAESKGTLRIVATPRVTALNNRPAQIESGQQIPVVTPQTGAGGIGGVLVFTTTFVSVPLRLSVTPQITDAGTVILRIVAENNSVNTTIAINGTPGIDTQRMSSEVLVPDGGTTVVGGVLAENDNQLQNRTPGLGSIPIVGNLFKRKLVTRQSQEILFFITPRIYRPDYQGRPTTAVVGTGNRTTTIPQPVPLGNPQSNTPTQQSQPQAPVQTPPNEKPNQK